MVLQSLMATVLHTAVVFASFGSSSGSAKTVNICEGSSKTVSCPAGSVIRIRGAMYGRLTKSICPAGNTGNTHCSASSGSMVTVRRRCEGKISCFLTATNSWFGDPCVTIFKYLSVRYSCFETDPCLSAYVREDNWQRSIKYNSSKSTSMHCDKDVENKWFRFVSKAGTSMPNKCPRPYACGTGGSIWLNGDYPVRVGQRVSAPVCVRTSTECCKSTWDIEIKKCHIGGEDFFLHRLSAVPSCPMSYCAGTEIPCPPGYNSVTGFTPGCERQYPGVTNVRLYHGVSEKRIQFACEFSSDSVNETDIFEVTWWQGAPAQQMNQTDVLTGAARKATLRNTNRYPELPLFYLGNTISCRVRSWFQYRNHSKSKHVESNHFYAGIKIFPEQLEFRLTEGQAPMKLTMRNTVPIVCEKYHKCFVVVEIGQTNVDNFIDVCSVRFEPGNANQTKEIRIVALRDFVNDGDHTMFVRFHIFDHIDPVDWNRHKRLPEIKIISVDVGTETCTATGDPHVTTFDKFYYHHYQVGDYVLVKSTHRKFAVHTRTWKCASVSCNCGVAAREGDDVIIVDMCRDKIPRARFASSVEPHPDTKLRRDRNGKSFQISFPSGAFVKVSMHRWTGNLWYANVEVQVVSDDYKCTEGLCGTFDGDKTNELKAKNGRIITSRHGAVAPTQFTESWKIPTGESLFYYRGGPRKCKAERVKHYCTCEETCCGKRKIKCDFTGYQKRPKYRTGRKWWRDLTFPNAKHCGRRKRRSTSDKIVLPDDDEDLFSYVYDPAPLSLVVPKWPTPSGKTLASTRAYCDRTIRTSEVAKICTKLIATFNLADYITECITDVQISDNDTFVMSSIEKMKNYCEEQALKDMTLWKPNPNKNGTLEPPIEVANVLCPNECSGNGQCVNGTCQCSSGFETADCSMRVGEGPIVITKWPPYFDGLCDMRKRDCSRARVSGYNFIDTDNLKCRASHAEYGKNGSFHRIGTVDVSRGYLLSFAEVMCELDALPTVTDSYETGRKGIPVGSLFLDVANSGRNYSAEQSLYVVYDSNCMNCTMNGMCTRKYGTCIVNGFCFQHGETSPSDYCQVCNELESSDRFSTRRVHLPPSIKTKSDWISLKGYSFELQIEASDPENQTVTFQLKENYEGVRLSTAGVFKWKPEKTGMSQFGVIAKDRCGKASSIVLNINVTLCACAEREVCQLVQNFTEQYVQCICPKGCTGPMCSEPIPGKLCNFIEKPLTVTEKRSNSTSLILGVTIGVALLVAIAFAIWYLVAKQKQTRGSQKKNAAVFNKEEAVAKVFHNDVYKSSDNLM